MGEGGFGNSVDVGDATKSVVEEVCRSLEYKKINYWGTTQVRLSIYLDWDNPSLPPMLANVVCVHPPGELL